MLGSTVDNLTSLQSATLDARVDAAHGAEKGSVRVRGPFQAGEKGEAPTFALSAEMTAGGRTESAGVTYTGDAAFATLQGKTYEVPSLIAGQLTAGVEQALSQGRPLMGIDLKAWVPNPTNAGVADVGGVETVKLTGKADVKRVAADIDLLAGQLQALQVPGMAGKAPKGLPADAADQVKDLTVTVYTGAEDRVLRRLVVEGTAAQGGGTALLDLTLTRVGEDQKIEAPKDARPFTELMAQLQGAGLFGG